MRVLGRQTFWPLKWAHSLRKKTLLTLALSSLPLAVLVKRVATGGLAFML